MASYDEVKLEDIVHGSFATFNPNTGANKDADSTPTIAVYEEGNSTAMTVTSSVTNGATGRYRWQITAAAADGFEAGKYYEVWITATVTGTDTVTQSTPVMSFKATTSVVDDTYALASGAAGFVAIDTVVDAILDDTGTTGVLLSSTALGAIWNRLTSSLTTVGSIGKWILDNLTGDIYARLGAPAGASIAADIAALKAETATIVVDTNELQTDWANGGRLDLILDARASQTSVDDIPTNAELATALATGVNVTQIDGSNLGSHGLGHFPADVRDWGGLSAAIAIDADNSYPSVATGHIDANAYADIRAAIGMASANMDTQLGDLPTNSELATALAAADDAVLAAIAALNNLSAAQVNAELLDVLNVDTFGELAAPPAASSTLRDKLTWIFMWARNRSAETSTQRKLYADDATTVVSTESVSDDGTTFEKGEAT